MAPLPEIPAIPPIVVMQAGSTTVPAAPGVAAPATPAVTPPATPSIGTPAPTNWPARAEALATQLGQTNGLSNVRTAIANLLEPDRAAIEAALPALAVGHPNLTTQAYLLRRIIRFARHGPANPRQPPVAMTGTGGVAVQGKQNRAVASAAAVSGGTVTFKTGVNIGTGRPASGGYTLEYSGGFRSAINLRWLQFIWRMVEVDLAGTGARLTHSPLRVRSDNPSTLKPLVLTTDPAHPRWAVDTTRGAKSAFYEEVTRRTPNELTLFDAPDAFLSTSGMAKTFFTTGTSHLGEALTKPPRRIVDHFRAATYLIEGMDVLYRADIHLTWEFTSVTAPAPKLSTKDPPRWSIVDTLDPEHRAVLERYYPEVDYLPGDLMTAPMPLDEFEAIPELLDADWATGSNHKARLSQVAELARARLVPSVLETGEASIRALSRDVKSGQGAGMPPNMTVVPGLNWSPTLGADGETGYLNGQIYLNPDIPIKRTDPVPGIAMKFGTSAFEMASTVRPKSVAVATMRHEMLHAAHEELAVDWLLAWRDELTTDAFDHWLLSQPRARRPTLVERSYVATGVTRNRIATEILAWTEGIAATLPFLPTPIVFDQHLLKQELWPGAVMSLHGIRPFYRNRTGPETDGASMEAAVEERLQSAICVMTSAQRAAVRMWIDFFLHVQVQAYAMVPTLTPQHVTMIALLDGDFRQIVDYLTTIQTVEKACPPPDP